LWCLVCRRVCRVVVWYRFGLKTAEPVPTGVSFVLFGVNNDMRVYLIFHAFLCFSMLWSYVCTRKMRRSAPSLLTFPLCFSPVVKCVYK
jgi:hypothetical protein